jgi:tRNA1Val (adenine37-N6)-methyltransferase
LIEAADLLLSENVLFCSDYSFKEEERFFALEEVDLYPTKVTRVRGNATTCY